MNKLTRPLLCASLVLLCGTAIANDFPTVDRVTYVQECMRTHPGPNYEMVNKCSCALDALAKDVGLSVADVSLARVMKMAGTLTWTRDPFDRMIVAHAMVADAALVSKDRLIRKHCDKAIW